MKQYKDTMDELRFTPEQKAHMVDRLMECAQASPRRPHTFRRVAVVGVAAALVLSVGVAGATGALGEVGERFSALFGPATQTEVIDQIGYPIGASATNHGITITADAIVGDTYSYAIVYSISREDGQPLVSQETLDGSEEYEGRLPLSLEDYDLRPTGPLAFLSTGGGGGFSHFYDADPTDNAIQFVTFWTSDTPIRSGKVSTTFRGLYDTTDSYANKTLLAEGPWTLDFTMDFEDSSIALPAGQAIQVSGMEATLDSVTLSPLSIMVEYTVHQEVPETARESGQTDKANDPYAPFRDLPVTISYTDGSTLEVKSATTSVGSGSGQAKCTIGMIFDSIRPLDEVASVTVGDVVIPVSQ
ncbi:DUF4179 domain-containing protein [uncultured Flavonifractor sp.]|uniref:DUF4179 domain-containing protein n=1 Tax=uncultured Flavonifractor sp. TaxID=1193534 RepID=UPI0026196DC1|nr:DUF4179 domain-containing protein [uncultured Flavonifractor sp.]